VSHQELQSALRAQRDARQSIKDYGKQLGTLLSEAEATNTWPSQKIQDLCGLLESASAYDRSRQARINTLRESMKESDEAFNERVRDTYGVTFPFKQPIMAGDMDKDALDEAIKLARERVASAGGIPVSKIKSESPVARGYHNHTYDPLPRGVFDGTVHFPTQNVRAAPFPEEFEKYFQKGPTKEGAEMSMIVVSARENVDKHFKEADELAAHDRKSLIQARRNVVDSILAYNEVADACGEPRIEYPWPV